MANKFDFGRFVGVGVGLMTVAACSGEETSDKSAASAAGPKDTLVIALQSDAKNFLGPLSQTAADMTIADLFNYNLVDAEFDCAVKYRPMLAKSWTFSADGTGIDMELRDDVTWADGQKVTAEDVAFTWDIVGDPAVASPRADNVEGMTTDARPKVIDATHLHWGFDHAFDRNTMLAHSADVAVAPKHILAAPGVDRASLRGHPLNATMPLASGPWKLVNWTKNEKIVFEANEHFTGPADDVPRLKRVIFKIIPEYATRLVELENGSIDLMEQLLVADADKLAATHPEIRLHRRGWRTMDFVAWNSLDAADYKVQAVGLPAGKKPDSVKKNNLFGDPAVRRALTMAIDDDKLIKDVLTSTTTGEVYGRPSVGNITPALCGIHNDDIKRIPFDPTAAKARFAELGWTDTNNDGVIDKDGVPFRFTMLTAAGNARRAKAGIIIQANLKDVGIDAQIEPLEMGTFYDRLRKRDYEAALGGWSASLFVDPRSSWGPDAEFNFSSYRNPKLDEAMAAAMAEPDMAKSAPIFKQIQQIIYDDQPYTFLYWMDDIVAVHQRFQDPTIDILAAYRNLNHWSVPADQVKYAQ